MGHVLESGDIQSCPFGFSDIIYIPKSAFVNAEKFLDISLQENLFLVILFTD
jgi:hypothetical protein